MQKVDVTELAESQSDKMPDKDKMIIVHVRLPGFDYVGRIEPEVLESVPQGMPQGMPQGIGIPGTWFKLYQPTAALVTQQKNNVNINCTDLSKITFWEEGPIYLPRNLSIILKVRIAGPLWTAYRNAIGESIQVYKTMPPGMAPPGSTLS